MELSDFTLEKILNMSPHLLSESEMSEDSCWAIFYSALCIAVGFSLLMLGQI